jgi:hypothetical protein
MTNTFSIHADTIAYWYSKNLKLQGKLFDLLLVVPSNLILLEY